MNLTPDNIDEIYDQNSKYRRRFVELLKTVTPEEAIHPQPGGWTIRDTAEHVAIVEDGMSRLCSRLLSAAREDGVEYSGGPLISESFREQLAASTGRQLEAPDMVKPSGSVPVAESIERLAASEAALDALRGDLAKYDLANHHFPHPYFGPMTAAEWLAMAGLHLFRHTGQIERMLAETRQ